MNLLKEKILKKFKESKNTEYKERYEHSLRVSQKAVELAQIINVDKEKAEIAGLVHDYAKFLTMDDFFEYVKEFNLDSSILDNNFKILHSLLAPYVIRKELGIEDEEILEACKFHTTGKARMTPLQEVLFLADFIEEGRVEAGGIREVAKTNYKKAIAMILDFKINKNVINKNEIHSNTLKAFEYYRIYLNGALDKLRNVISTIDHNLVKDINIYDIRNQTPLFDYIVIATALSVRQMEAAANYLKTNFDLRGLEIGEAWTLVDIKDIIVHLFTEDEREKYSLDKLLKDLPQIIL